MDAQREPKDLAELGARSSIETMKAERIKRFELAEEPPEIVCKVNAAGRAAMSRSATGLVADGEGHHQWGEPERFEKRVRTKLPIDAFPSALADWARAVADAICVPAEAVVMAGLTVAGFALTGKVKVRVRAAGNPWEESTNLYTVIVGPSGANKTGLFKLAIAPLEESFKAHVDAMRTERAEHSMRLKIAKARADKAEKVAAKGPATDPVAENDAIEAARVVSELEEATPKEPFGLAGGDVTAEGIVKALARWQRVMLASDEPTLFDTLTGRYAGDGKANFDVLLKAKDGTPYSDLRAGRESIVIPSPRAGVLVMAQPVTAATMSERKGHLKERGLLGRFAVCWPEWPTATIPDLEADDLVVPEDLRRGYHQVIAGCLAMPYPSGDESVPEVSLSPSARAHFAPYNNIIADELADGGAYAQIASAGSKSRGMVASIALIFHVMESGHLTGQVSGATMQNAIRVVEALLDHALRFDGAGREKEEEDEAEILWGYIQRLAIKQGPSGGLAVNDLVRCAQPRMNAKTVKRLLKVLAERKLVSQVKEVQGPTGRPAARFDVSPRA